MCGIYLGPTPGSEDTEEMDAVLEPLEKDIADAVMDNEEYLNEAD